MTAEGSAEVSPAVDPMGDQGVSRAVDRVIDPGVSPEANLMAKWAVARVASPGIATSVVRRSVPRVVRQRVMADNAPKEAVAKEVLAAADLGRAADPVSGRNARLGR